MVSFLTCASDIYCVLFISLMISSGLSWPVSTSQVKACSIIGVGLGLLLCWIQQEYGIITLGTSGSFIVDAYPVSVHLSDILLIFVTVLLIGLASVWYPVHSLGKRLVKK